MSGSSLRSHGFTGSWGVALSILVQEDESPSFQVLPVFIYGCETCTLTRDLRQRLHCFGTRSLRRILCNHWSEFVSNERLLKETQMSIVACNVWERQLLLCGDVDHFPHTDPAHQILSARSLLSGGGQWADHVPRGCSRFIGISKRRGWARHLPGGWPDGGP